MNLRRCPCGKVPTGFAILGWDNVKTIHAIPNCCGYDDIAITLDKEAGRMTAEERHQAACQAWNDMPGEGE